MQDRSNKNQGQAKSLKIHDIELAIRLGCSEQERAVAQKVLLSVDIRFCKDLAACDSDNLEQTICYDLLVKEVLAGVQNREFHLIEFLAKEIYKTVDGYISQTFSKGTLIRISVLKCHLPVEWKNKGAEFVYGDF